MALFRTRGRNRVNTLPQRYGNMSSDITAKDGNAAGGSGSGKSFFAGGDNFTGQTIDDGITNEVNAFDVMTEFYVLPLSTSRADLAVADCPYQDTGYVVFAYGQSSFINSTVSNVVDVYDVDTGTRTSTTFYESKTHVCGKGFYDGSYYIFLGGYGYDGNNQPSYSNVGEAVDSTLTKRMWSSSTLLDQINEYMCSAIVYGSTNHYVLFCYNNGTTTPQLYTISDNFVFGDLTLTGLSGQVDNMAASTIKVDANTSYALFAGGDNGSSSIIRGNKVGVIDNNLTYHTTLTLSVARTDLMGVELNTSCMFVGGISNSGRTNVIDVFDKYLTRYNNLILEYNTARPAVATVKDSTNNRVLGLVNDNNSTNYDNIEIFYENY